MPYLVLKWLTYVHTQSLCARFLPGYGSQTINLLAGAVAGAVAATSVTPADVIKTRMQVEQGTKATVFSVGKDLLAEGGLPAFFRGLGPRLARIPMYTSITLATFDFVKDAFLRSQNLRDLTNEL